MIKNKMSFQFAKWKLYFFSRHEFNDTIQSATDNIAELLSIEIVH